MYLNVEYFKPSALKFQSVLLVRLIILCANAVFFSFGFTHIVQLAVALYT
jgi:hypothetical protein